jgi:hypothetical protein
VIVVVDDETELVTEVSFEVALLSVLVIVELLFVVSVVVLLVMLLDVVAEVVDEVLPTTKLRKLGLNATRTDKKVSMSVAVAFGGDVGIEV